jgi:hypothetical protein
VLKGEYSTWILVFKGKVMYFNVHPKLQIFLGSIGFENLEEKGPYQIPEFLSFARTHDTLKTVKDWSILGQNMQ